MNTFFGQILFGILTAAAMAGSVALVSSVVRRDRRRHGDDARELVHGRYFRLWMPLTAAGAAVLFGALGLVLTSMIEDFGTAVLHWVLLAFFAVLFLAALLDLPRLAAEGRRVFQFDDSGVSGPGWMDEPEHLQWQEIDEVAYAARWEPSLYGWGGKLALRNHAGKELRISVLMIGLTRFCEALRERVPEDVCEPTLSRVEKKRLASPLGKAFESLGARGQAALES